MAIISGRAVASGPPTTALSSACVPTGTVDGAAVDRIVRQLLAAKADVQSRNQWGGQPPILASLNDIAPSVHAVEGLLGAQADGLGRAGEGGAGPGEAEEEGQGRAQAVIPLHAKGQPHEKHSDKPA